MAVNTVARRIVNDLYDVLRIEAMKYTLVVTNLKQVKEQIVITLLQSYKIDGGNRLVTSCSNKTIRNKLLRTCCHQLVNKTISALPEQLVARLLGASILL